MSIDRQVLYFIHKPSTWRTFSEQKPWLVNPFHKSRSNRRRAASCQELAVIVTVSITVQSHGLESSKTSIIGFGAQFLYFPPSIHSILGYIQVFICDAHIIMSLLTWILYIFMSWVTVLPPTKKMAKNEVLFITHMSFKILAKALPMNSCHGDSPAEYPVKSGHLVAK